MKEIKIKYSEYELPENPDIFYKIGKFGSEFFGAKLYREDKTFSIKVENPDLFLSNNKSFSVKNEFIEKVEAEKKAGANSDEAEDAVFNIKKWQYKFLNENDCEILVTAQKRKSSQLDSLYASMSDGWQVMMPFLTFMLIAALCLIIYGLISDYPNPLVLWSAVGKHIQTIISWSLFLLLSGLFIWSLFIYRGSIIVKSYLAALFVLSAIIIPIFWATISAKPAEFVGQPDENILYLNYLLNYFSTSSLILVGVIPWIAIFLKHLGFSLLPAILTQMHKEKSKS